MVCLEVDWFDEASRDAFMQALKARGIDSRPYFCTMSSMPMYRQPLLPVSARKAQIGLNLPSYFELTKAEVQRMRGCERASCDDGSGVNGQQRSAGCRLPLPYPSDALAIRLAGSSIDLLTELRS